MGGPHENRHHGPPPSRKRLIPGPRAKPIPPTAEPQKNQHERPQCNEKRHKENCWPLAETVAARRPSAYGAGMTQPGPAIPNLPEYTVGEVARAVKRTVEGAFERVRVRGEISGFKRAASGHLYLALKDETAVLDSVVWRAAARRLSARPEDGLEVVCEGRLTTYAPRSRYQLIVESMRVAGAGALLALLEERRRKLAAEGLFDEARKRPVPFLPAVVGLVTSPSGAAIRDILQRLGDRFPRPVLVWPARVQGDGAAAEIAAAIAGFNRLAPGGAVPRPDVLIVARGGGSIEDLWAFNEEAVVRAAAASAIPFISAVGHETDTTLIDHAADWRAATPTAAAEKAVPVRADLAVDLLDRTRRLAAGFAPPHRRPAPRRRRAGSRPAAARARRSTRPRSGSTTAPPASPAPSRCSASAGAPPAPRCITGSEARPNNSRRRAAGTGSQRERWAQRHSCIMPRNAARSSACRATGACPAPRAGSSPNVGGGWRRWPRGSNR